MSEETKGLFTSISEASPEKIIIRGKSLTDLMGSVSFGDATFFVLTGRLPSNGESTLFNAILVSLIDHGIATQALAARWTIRTAPEAIQGAMAAAVLGVGDQFGGVAEKVGEMLSNLDKMMHEKQITDDQATEQLVSEFLRQKKKIPGLGHTTHKSEDPRASKLFSLAEGVQISRKYIDLIQLVKKKTEIQTKRSFAINAMGAIGAIIMDLGLDWKLAKGLMVISKTPGILAHVNEEINRPMMDDMADGIKKMFRYDGPTA